MAPAQCEFGCGGSKGNNTFLSRRHYLESSVAKLLYNALRHDLCFFRTDRPSTIMLADIAEAISE
jgi:hypothetical protein